MSDSKRQSSARKPAAHIRSERKAAIGLPPEFPLFPHASGRWAKQVRGKRHYFGKIAEAPKGEAALRLWLEQKDELLAGRTPRAKSDELTVGRLCDRFLQTKDAQLAAGEISHPQAAAAGSSPADVSLGAGLAAEAQAAQGQDGRR